MLKKSITYKDFNGVEQTEEFHFHLSAEKLMELESTLPGGFEKYTTKVMESGDGGQILDLFKKIIRMSIGRVSEDGKRFDQNDEITADFVSTNAYTKLFIMLGKDADTAAKFFNGLVPQDLAEQVEELKGGNGEPVTRERFEAERRHRSASPKVLTQAEAQAMSQEELLAKMKDGWTIQT